LRFLLPNVPVQWTLHFQILLIDKLIARGKYCVTTLYSALLLDIQVVPSSGLGLRIGYTDSFIVVFLSAST
jgi:hypothetical protein